MKLYNGTMLYKIVTHQHGATLTYLNLTDAAALLKARDLRSRGVTILIVGQAPGDRGDTVGFG